MKVISFGDCMAGLNLVMLYSKSVFTDADSKIVVLNNKDFNKILYGLYISAGYNTINVYAHYGLNSFFKSAKIEGESIDYEGAEYRLFFISYSHKKSSTICGIVPKSTPY
jgi:hypothetical protein